MKQPLSLRARALNILARQEISRIDLKRKLAPYADNENELDQLLDELAERNWQSDERFAEAYIHGKSKRHGTLRLKQTLQQKGIDNETAASFLPNREQELQTAIEVLHKKFKQPAQDMKEIQKQMRFLAYRGFDTDTIRAALKSDWFEED